MIVTSITLRCDRCPATVAGLPGDAGSARRHAAVLHGWRRVRGEYGLPVDLCPTCDDAWRRRQFTARLAQQFGLTEDDHER